MSAADDLRFLVQQANGPDWVLLGQLLASHRDGTPFIWWHSEDQYDAFGNLRAGNSVAIAKAYDAARRLDSASEEQ